MVYDLIMASLYPKRFGGKTYWYLREMGRVDGNFFFNDTATPEISTLSLHDALPISVASAFAALTQSRSFRPDPYDARGACDVLASEALGGFADANTVKLLVHA